MSDTSPQTALIRKLYAAMGDVNSFKSLLADDVEWDIAEGFPNGGVYRGIDAVVNDFFTFLADFDEFYAKGGRVLRVRRSRDRSRALFRRFEEGAEGAIPIRPFLDNPRRQGRAPAADRRHPSHRTSSGEMTGATNGSSTAGRGGHRV